MFIPISTDRPPKRRPIVNQTIITINLVVYLLGLMGEYAGWFEFDTVQRWGHFNPNEFQAWQLLTYQFMHDPGGIGHLLFNMIFLWVFGNAVESRLGRVGYLSFYLMAGCVAGIAHGMWTSSAVIGASGSIAGVSGAFLALFPRARIKVLVLFFIIGIFPVPATWFILFYFVLDFINLTFGMFGSSGSNVAYGAHLAGYTYGFFVCFALLGFKILKREEFDIFFLFKQMRRRQQFRAGADSPAMTWDNPKADSAEQMGKRKVAGPLTEPQRKYAAERSEISALLATHDLAGAADKYCELLGKEPKTVMPEQRQVDLANHLYQHGNLATATRAYELLLEYYPSCREADQVRLILGLIYTRREPRPDRARELLEEVKTKLDSDGEIALADELLAELEQKTGGSA